MEYTAVIRTKNSEQTISLCIISILKQELKPKEILIVDSGSNDRTLEICSSYKEVRMIKYPNIDFNYSKALNIGLNQVTTMFALIISSHVDLIGNRVAQKLIELTQAHNVISSSIGWGGDRFVISEEEIQYNNITFSVFDLQRFKGFGMTNICSMIKVKKWKEYPFNEKILRCEDQDWAYYFIKQGYKTVFITSKLLNYRNPRYNAKKDYWDYVYIDNFIYPGYLNTRFIRGKIKALKQSLIRIDFKESIHLIKVILLLKFGNTNPKSIVSKYF